MVFGWSLQVNEAGSAHAGWDVEGDKGGVAIASRKEVGWSKGLAGCHREDGAGVEGGGGRACGCTRLCCFGDDLSLDGSHLLGHGLCLLGLFLSDRLGLLSNLAGDHRSDSRSNSLRLCGHGVDNCLGRLRDSGRADNRLCRLRDSGRIDNRLSRRRHSGGVDNRLGRLRDSGGVDNRLCLCGDGVDNRLGQLGGDDGGCLGDGRGARATGGDHARLAVLTFHIDRDLFTGHAADRLGVEVSGAISGVAGVKCSVAVKGEKIVGDAEASGGRDHRAGWGRFTLELHLGLADVAFPAALIRDSAVGRDLQGEAVGAIAGHNLPVVNLLDKAKGRDVKGEFLREAARGVSTTHEAGQGSRNGQPEERREHVY